jgi:chemotaxis protein CheD
MCPVTARRKRFTPFSEAPRLKRVTIHVGEIYASRNAAVVQTLLGSCVSVCLVDREAGVGGMNHILLPGKAKAGSCDAASRYGVNAMEMLIGKVQNLGGDRRRLEAKVFGGGNILNGLENRFNPGWRNCTFAMEFLEIEGIPVMGQDVGGENARMIYLRTDTGEVLMKRIPGYRAATVAREEKKYSRKVQGEIAGSGGVTLLGKK